MAEKKPLRKPELGKYLLWLHFSKDASIRRYLPTTRRMNKSTFTSFLNTYRMIYVKPSGGSRGVGIFKVWLDGKAVKVKKTTLRARTFANPEAAWHFINADSQGKAHVVQQGIRLANVNGRPFDIRVMVQRTEPGGEWKYSGMIAKVAGKSSIVTNVALSRGNVMEVDAALRQGLGWKKEAVSSKMKEMKRLALMAGKHFDTYQPYRELGFDMAVDTKGRLWLIEENTAPSHPLFKRLTSNLSMWRTIEYRWGQYTRALRGKYGQTSNTSKRGKSTRKTIGKRTGKGIGKRT